MNIVHDYEAEGREDRVLGGKPVDLLIPEPEKGDSIELLQSSARRPH
jgi:hypothetical protein